MTSTENQAGCTQIIEVCQELTNELAIEFLRIKGTIKHQQKPSSEEDDLAEEHSIFNAIWSLNDADQTDWYSRLAYVLLAQIASFSPIIRAVRLDSGLVAQFALSVEILNYYACLLATIRFLDGLSWGYSEMLIHDDVDQETKLTIKVVFNLLLKVK